MAYSISVTKRTNGGFTIVTESSTYYSSDLIYHGTTTGVTLYSKGVTSNLYKPTEWTIQGVTGFTTVTQVVDALDALGISSESTVAISGTVTEANSAAIKTAVETIQGQDFLIINDTAEHATLDCTMIYVMVDAVFASIEVDGVEIIDSSDDVKGLDGVTVVAGTLLPFGKEHATSITLTSGTIIAYIN